MTVQQFEQAVAEHIDRLIAFSREVGKPRPVAHPLVEMAVKRISHPKSAKLPDDFMADYVVVDDTPPPPPPLNIEDRKRALVAAVHAAEHAAKHAVLPQRKHRLLNLNYSEAVAKPEQARTADDNLLISAAMEAGNKMRAIEMVAAQAESDIEDLTEDTVDSWQVPNFG
jgi:hypothetical protein